jgi:hypothetical protein
MTVTADLGYGRVFAAYTCLQRSDHISICVVAGRVPGAQLRTSAHDPIAIVANPDARAGLLEAKILQQLYSVRELWVLLETPFSLPY